LGKTAEESDYDFKILKSVMHVNALQKQKIYQKVYNFFNNNLEGKTIAVWGLAFKPNTDDIREAPAIETIRGLLDKGAKVRAFDPEAMDNMKAVFGNEVYFAHDMYDVLDGADVLAIMTEWSVFRMPEFGRLKTLLKQPAIFDGRNLYDLEDMERLGFYYASIGRKTVNEKVHA
jgi:UDPglucose 6-dehydrogenase